VSGRDLYRWVARGAADCAICARLDGEERSLGLWQLTRMPGFHRHCDCRLEPVINGQPANPARPRRPERQAGLERQPKAAPRRVNFRGQIAGRPAALKPVLARVNRPRVGQQARRFHFRAAIVKKGISRHKGR